MPIFYTDTASFNLLSVTGSTIMSGSSNATTLQIIGSGSTILSVSGSGGGIFAITDITSSNANLFSVSSGSIDIFTVDSFKNVKISGSLIVTGSITGSLQGTASFATTASFALNAGGGSSNITIGDESVTQGTATYLNFLGAGVTAAVSSNTASITIAGGGGGSGFPFAGTALITGSIVLTSGSGFPSLLASETLAAGDLVNIFSGGVRKASSNDTTKQAHGFVTASYSSTNPVVVFYSGLLTNTSGLTAGARYFLGTSGAESTTPPVLTGQLSQEIGVAISTTALLFQPGPAIIT
jgi:hypothetical protein